MKKKHYIYCILTLGFILGIHDGKIALWQNGQADPARVFPYRAELLPEEDQKALENGIHIDSEEKLAELMEDYLS